MSWPTRRWRLVLAGATVAGLLTVGTLSERWFIRPPSASHPAPADAVVMFGGAGPRFERAVGLVESDHVATVLALSDPGSAAGGVSAFGWYCAGRNAPTEADQEDRYGETLCFDPDPDTTFGEAKAVRRLAAARGWQRVVIVVSVDQATRAHMMVRRCFAGHIEIVTVPTTKNRFLRVGYEWAASAYYAVAHRSC